MTGYGQDGPYADRGGPRHQLHRARGRAARASAPPSAPVPPLNLVGDYGGGGMLLAVGLLSAILDARASQQGQVVDVAMVDGAATLMTPYLRHGGRGTWRDRRHANVFDGAAHYYGVYETADDKHVAVGAMEPQFYAELCERLGVDVPQDENDPTAWAAHRAVLARAVPREDPGRMGTTTQLAGMLRRTRAQPRRSAAAPAQRGARHLHRDRRRRATRAGAAVLADSSRTTPTGPALPGDHTREVLAEPRAWTTKPSPGFSTRGVARQSSD